MAMCELYQASVGNNGTGSWLVLLLQLGACSVWNNAANWPDISSRVGEDLKEIHLKIYSEMHK